MKNPLNLKELFVHNPFNVLLSLPLNSKNVQDNSFFISAIMSYISRIFFQTMFCYEPFLLPISV